jgi:adenine-specific DNA-methyltransferase
MAKKPQSKRTVETLTHEKARRKNIPTAEYQSVLQKEEQNPVRIAYERRNRDLDPQLVWRGKDEQDWSDLVVHAPPLYIQEKVHPKVLIDDLLKQTREQRDQEAGAQTDLFADFNGIPLGVDKTEFYQHDQNWSNRMILGDSLQVMASLAEREGLRGKVQCIYLDPPYGIKFNSNFQWSTTSRDVKDGNVDHITREPEQVKAFRDTWRDGIHSYLTYLRDRLTVARDLLADSGSIFVQIGDENVHRVRAVLDEVFGEDNFVISIVVTKTTSATSMFLAGVVDHLLWYSRSRDSQKYRSLFSSKDPETKGYDFSIDDAGCIRRAAVTLQWRKASLDNLTSQSGGETTRSAVNFEGLSFSPSSGGWKTSPVGMQRLKKASRLAARGRSRIFTKRTESVRSDDLGPQTVSD